MMFFLGWQKFPFFIAFTKSAIKKKKKNFKILAYFS